MTGELSKIYRYQNKWLIVHPYSALFCLLGKPYLYFVLSDSDFYLTVDSGHRPSLSFITPSFVLYQCPHLRIVMTWVSPTLASSSDLPPTLSFSDSFFFLDNLIIALIYLTLNFASLLVFIIVSQISFGFIFSPISV